MHKLCAAQWTLCSGLLTRERMCAVSWSAARYALVYGLLSDEKPAAYSCCRVPIPVDSAA